MTFDQILPGLKEGLHYKQSNGNGDSIHLTPNHPDHPPRPIISITRHSTTMSWEIDSTDYHLSVEEILADDWELVP